MKNQQKKTCKKDELGKNKRNYQKREELETCLMHIDKQQLLELKDRNKDFTKFKNNQGVL